MNTHNIEHWKVYRDGYPDGEIWASNKLQARHIKSMEMSFTSKALNLLKGKSPLGATYTFRQA